MTMSQKSFEEDLSGFFKSIRVPILLVLSLWIVKALEILLEKNYIRFGIYPRDIDGISGIFLSPFIHGSMEHLISNSFPLLFVLVMLRFFYQRISVMTTILVWLFTGILVWLFARPAYHIGASGVVYGLLGFLLWSGLFRRDNKSITLSLLILAIYSTYFLGFEKTEGVSWESHMIGALVGLVFAFAFRNVREPDDHPQELQEYVSHKEKFFAPDTFEKTKQQRWMESQLYNDADNK